MNHLYVLARARAAWPAGDSDAFRPCARVIHAALLAAELDQHVRRISTSKYAARVYLTRGGQVRVGQLREALSVLWSDADTRILGEPGTTHLSISTNRWIESTPRYRTPERWAAQSQMRIVDPDGWRGTGGLPAKDFDEPVTLEEFKKRAVLCTVDQRALLADSNLPGFTR